MKTAELCRTVLWWAICPVCDKTIELGDSGNNYEHRGRIVATCRGSSGHDKPHKVQIVRYRRRRKAEGSLKEAA